MNAADLHRRVKIRTPPAAKGLFFALLAVFVGSSWYLGFRCDFDGHDAYVFLAQSHRLSDPASANFGFDFTRPRGLVFLLAGVEWIFRALTRNLPRVHHYHPLMTLLSALSIWVWAKFAEEAWGTLVGYAAGILLVAHALIFTNSMAILSDVPSTGLWGASLLIFLRLTKLASAAPNVVPPVRPAILWGFVLGWLALAKYQYFFLPAALFGFVFVFVWALPTPRAVRVYWMKTLGIAASAWVVTIDLVQRVAGQAHEGFWYTPVLYISYMRQLIDDTLQREPVTVYVQNFFQSYGVIFCALFVLGAIALVVELRKTVRARRAPDLFVSAFFVVNIFYLVFIQSIHHRESRYILPLIPAILCAAVRGLGLIFDRGARGALAVLALFILALPYSLRQETRAFSSYEAQCAMLRRIDYASFFSYLRSATPNRVNCAVVHACQTEIERPEYMVRLGGLPVRVTYCHKKYGDFREQMTTAVEPGRCYVLASSDLYGDPPNGVFVRKVMGAHLNGEQKIAFEAMATAPENVRCESEPKGKFTCFAEREFF